MAVEFRGGSDIYVHNRNIEDEESGRGQASDAIPCQTRKTRRIGRICYMLLGFLIILTVVLVIVLVRALTIPAGQLNVPTAVTENETDTANGNQTQAFVEGMVTSLTTAETVQQTVPEDYTMDGWRRSDSEDYISKVFLEQVDYATATTMCVNHGARLAAEILRHPDAVRYIIESGHIAKYTNGYAPWVGFDDRQTEGEWVWNDGGEMNHVTTAWDSPQQPDNAQGAEDCGHIWKHAEGRVLLNDAPCSFLLHYICEKRLNVL